MTILGHMLLGWLCSATYCQDGNPKQQSFHPGNMLPGWQYSATCDQVVSASLYFFISLCLSQSISLSVCLSIYLCTHAHTHTVGKSIWKPNYTVLTRNISVSFYVISYLLPLYRSKFEDQFTYFNGNISSTESYVNIPQGNAWTSIVRLSII